MNIDNSKQHDSFIIKYFDKSIKNSKTLIKHALHIFLFSQNNALKYDRAGYFCRIGNVKNSSN